MNVDKIAFYHSGYVSPVKIEVIQECKPLPVQRNVKCKECGKTVSPLLMRNTYCSKTCGNKSRNRAREDRDRIRLKSAFIENIDRIVVFEKHNWKCVMCGVDTPKELMGRLDLNAPTLDHVVPLSKGGKHAYYNVQLLCRRCNCHIKGGNV